MTTWATGDYTNYGSGSMVASPYQQYGENVGNPELHWESSTKQNYGFEAAVFKNLINLNVEYFLDDRSNIFMTGNQRSVANFFGPAAVSANLGKTHTQGYEIEVKLNKTFGKVNTWASTAFTHAKDKVLYYEDPLLLPSYQKVSGFQIAQTKNQIPAGYVNNWNDVYGNDSICIQHKTMYQPGDIRTVDFNGDGVPLKVIMTDSAPYGYPTRPQNTYNNSLRLGVDWKGWSIMASILRSEQCFASDPGCLCALYSDWGTTTYTKVYDPDKLMTGLLKTLTLHGKRSRFTQSNTYRRCTFIWYDASYFRSENG